MARQQWKPGSPSDFDDLVESPRWHQPSAVFAAVAWGAVITSVGLVVAVVLDRNVPAEAWSAPAALATFAGLIWASPKRDHEKHSETQSRPRAK